MKHIPKISHFIGIFFVCAYFIGILSGCTYSINLAHTEGTATDLIDENQAASPTISPNISMPLTAGAPANMPNPHPPGMNGPDRKSV